MLPRQQSRRHDQSHLGAGNRHRKRRPQRHLGLAETDVTAYQPVHRNSAVQILQNVRNRIKLVVRLVIRKFGTKFIIQPLRRHKCLGFFQMPLSRNPDKLFGNVANTLLDFGFFGLPRQTADSVKLNIVILYAVPGNHVNIFYRNKQLGIIGI